MTPRPAAPRAQAPKRLNPRVDALGNARRLDEIRRATQRSQAEVAGAMGVGQSAISQLEGRSDIQLSTLVRYLEALGLALELTVVLPSGHRVALNDFKPDPGVTARAASRTTRRQYRRTGSSLQREDISPLPPN